MNLVGEVEKDKAIRKMRLGIKMRDWAAVLRTVGGLPPCAELWLAKMNKWADTLLHAAIIYRAPTAVVDELLGKMRRREVDVMEIVSARNQWGNTPLHCAASRGSPFLCHSILHALPTEEQMTRAVVERNKEGETPVFLAAVHGHQRAFRLLSDFVEPEHTTAPYVKRNGNSVLHLTIQRKDFKLSLAIMNLLPDVVSIINEKGQAPLDVLASIPSAFSSATHLSWWEKLCYPFITIRPILPPCLRRSDRDHDGPPDQLPKPEAPFGFSILKSTMEKKRRHVFGSQIMKRLLDNDAFYDSLMERDLLGMDDDHPAKSSRLGPSHNAPSLLGWTPLLRATKYGAIEMVWAILEKKPFAIEDESDEKKNVMLVAVEERQSTLLMQFMKKPSIWNRKLHHATDVHGNTALHLVAKLSRHTNAPMPAVHMQWEVHWFQYVKSMMPLEFNELQNLEGKTPGMMFEEEHSKLMQRGYEWIKEMSGNYIVATTLISSVTFATCFQIPGGYDGDSGRPIVGFRIEFNVFVITALVSFCSSVTSLAAFLAVHSSQSDRPENYRRRLPLTLCLGLCSLFLSVVSMLISFCAAHTFELIGPLNKRSKYVPLYVGFTLFPLWFYGATQIPLYWHLIKASFSRVPLPRPFYEEQFEETPPKEKQVQEETPPKESQVQEETRIDIIRIWNYFKGMFGLRRG